MSEFRNKVMERLEEGNLGRSMLGVEHGSVHDIDTPHFKGKVTLTHRSVKNGRRNDVHTYTAEYDGHLKKPSGLEPHKSRSSIDISKDKVDERIDNIKSSSGHSSKNDLKKVLHKSAPQWVSIEALRPGSK